MVFHEAAVKAYPKLRRIGIANAGIYTWFYVREIVYVCLSNLTGVHAGNSQKTITLLLLPLSRHKLCTPATIELP